MNKIIVDGKNLKLALDFIAFNYIEAHSDHWRKFARSIPRFLSHNFI
jgi:hypothetical protein